MDEKHFYPPFLREAVVTIVSLFSLATAISASINRLKTILSAMRYIKVFAQIADKKTVKENFFHFLPPFR